MLLPLEACLRTLLRMCPAVVPRAWPAADGIHWCRVLGKEIVMGWSNMNCYGEAACGSITLVASVKPRCNPIGWKGTPGHLTSRQGAVT